MSTKNEFVNRVLQRLPKGAVGEFSFTSWDSGRPTSEGFGIMAVPGADPEKVIDRVMDVDHYVGNIKHVVISRSIPDAKYTPPESVRFYHKVKIPLIGDLQHELVLERLGTVEGYAIAAWSLLERETAALNKRDGIRSAYNDGAWLVKPGVVGYALSSAPIRDDVGFLKWKALTKGADVAAASAIKDNIRGMTAWAARG